MVVGNSGWHGGRVWGTLGQGDVRRRRVWWIDQGVSLFGLLQRLWSWLAERVHWPWSAPAKGWIGPRTQPAPDVDPRVVEQGLRLAEILIDQGIDLTTRRVVHLGLGDAPVMPLLWSLAGCPEVVLVEHERLLDRPLLRETAVNLARHASQIAARLGLDVDEVKRRLHCPRECTFFETLRHFRMQYAAPYDLLRDPLPQREADLVTARSLLDAYARPYVRAVLQRAATRLPPHSRLCLCIDQPEHYEYTTLLHDTGFVLEVDEHQPVLKVVDTAAASPHTDSNLLNSYLVAEPAGRKQEQAQG